MKKTLSLTIISLLLISSVFAQNTEIKPEKYGILDSAYDTVRLAFTRNAEHRLEIINQIAEKRARHYDFLISKGKTDVAEKYLQTTETFISGRLAKLNTTTENKQIILNRIYNNTNPNREKIMIVARS